MFCAHVDTVPHRGQVEVVDDEGVFRSRGETILGADNKAAVAVFMELVARHVERPGPVGIELVLTVAEEQGLRGAKAFDAAQLRSRAGFVLDHAGPVGEVIVATPTQQKILADFIGVEAHAGIKPEEGSSAIAAAAAAVARMELGRLDEGTTANVGLISGGTSGQRRPRSLLRSTPRRAASTPSGRPRWRGRSPTPAPGARASTAATSTCGSKSSSAATRCRPTRRRWRWPRRGCGRPGWSRGGWRSAAAATPTSSASTASTASCSPTAPMRSTPPTRWCRREPGEDARGLRGHRRGGGRAGAGVVAGRLKLRRGVVVSTDPLVVEVGGERRPAWADEVAAGGDARGRRGRRQRRRARPRPRLRRLRRRPRQPHPRPGRGRGGGRARDEAQLHLAPASRRPGRAPRHSPVPFRPWTTKRNRRGGRGGGGTAAARAPGAGGLGGGAGGARAPGRVRADRRRGAAGLATRATSASCASAACSAATSPRPRPTAASTRR